MTAAAAVLSLLLSLLIPGGEAGGQPVAGLLHQSVELYPLHLSLPVLEVTWKFITQEKTKKVAGYHKDQFTPYDPQFSDRLKLSNNGTKLRISDLRMEDTGVYTAEVSLTNSEISHETYVLTVYEPIPSPNITVKGSLTDRCNVTLHCSVPSHTSDFSYTWKYRLQDSEYQLYSHGGTIQISLPPDHQDMEFLCIVQNPADQKNVSIAIRNICLAPKDGNDFPYGRYFSYAFFTLLLTALLVRMCLQGRKGDLCVSSMWGTFALNTTSLLTFILLMRLTPIYV